MFRGSLRERRLLRCKVVRVKRPWWTRGERVEIHDEDGAPLEMSSGRIRWFYTEASAQKFLSALLRGNRHPAGFRG